MSSFSTTPSTLPGTGDASISSRLDILRAEAEAETDPARRARLLHGVGRLVDIVERNDVAAANEYLAAFQANRAQRMALVDLIGIYERRKSPTNLAKLYQVEAKTAVTPEDKASALLDLMAVRADLSNDLAGGAAALAEAVALAPEYPDVALAAEIAGRLVGDSDNLPTRLRARLAGCDDPVLAAELAIDLADALVAMGQTADAIAELARSTAVGAPGVRVALALERLARRSNDGEARATALERLGDLATSALTDAASFEEPGLGPLLWEDSIAARALAVAAYRAAAAVRSGRDGEEERVVLLYTKAIDVEPNAPWTRLERLATAQRIGRDDLVAEDEEALADAITDGPLAAFVLHRLAARLERVGRPEDAEAARAEAGKLAPSSAVLAAAVEAGVRNRAQATRWLEALGADDPAARYHRLVEAAFICDELLDDYPRAHNYYERAIEAATEPLPILRALYAAALLRDDAATAAAALARMTSLDAASERSRRLERAIVAAVHLDDPTPAALLARSLLEGEASAELAQLARSIGALTDDFDLVAAAHARLAALTASGEIRAAHRCAGARALVSAGKPAEAEAALRTVLDEAPGHAVAVAMLDAMLRARGDVDGLAELGRRAAIGRAGEPESVVEAVRAAVDAAVSGRSDEAARLARALLTAEPERPIAARTAAYVASEIADAELAILADDRLVRTDGGELAAFAALRCAQRAMAAGALEEAGRLLGVALAAPATALEAAIGYALLPASLRTDDLTERARAVLTETAGADADRYFAPAASATADGEDPIARAAKAPSAEIAEAQLEMMLDAQAGPGAGLALLVARTVALADGQDIRDDLGILVLRAASTAGGGEIASALSEISFGPHDDLTVTLAATEAALREAAPRERGVLESRLGRLLHAAGRPKDAVTHLALALEARPDDLGALEALRIAARDAGDHERFVTACDRLAEQATGTLRAELLEDAAAVLESRLGRPADALSRARRAMDAAPGRERAYQTVRALLTALRDDAGLAELAASRAHTGDATARVKQLFEVARLRRAAGDKEGTVEAIRALLAVDPQHAGALAMRVELAVSMEAFDEAVDALRALAKADVPPAQKRVARLGAADFLERKLGKANDALAELRAIDELGLADPAILQRMARLAESEDAFAEALALHDRVRNGDASPLRRVESERAAARLRWKFGRDPEGAADGYRRVLEIAPDDVDAAGTLMRLVQDDAQKVEIGRKVDAAVRAAIVPEKLEVDALRRLLRVADLRGARDLMKLVLATLSVLRVATDDERTREEENTAIVRRVRPPTHPITEALFRMHAPGDEGPYAEIAAQLFELLVEHDDLQLGRLGANRSEPMPRTDGVRSELVDLAAAFGLAESEAFVSAQFDPRRIVAVPVERGVQFVVPRNAAIPLDPELRFHAGRQIWAVARRTLPFVQRPPQEGAAILLGALDACEVAIGEAKARPGVAEWSKIIGRGIARKNKKTIHDLGATLTDRGLGAEAYCRATRQSALRAGLLVSSDLDAALASVLGTATSFERVAETPEAADLVCFHLSSTSLTLRRELGLAS